MQSQPPICCTHRDLTSPVWSWRWAPQSPRRRWETASSSLRSGQPTPDLCVTDDVPIDSRSGSARPRVLRPGVSIGVPCVTAYLALFQRGDARGGAAVLILVPAGSRSARRLECRRRGPRRHRDGWHFGTPAVGRRRWWRDRQLLAMFASFGDGLGPAYVASQGGIDKLTKALAVAYAADTSGSICGLGMDRHPAARTAQERPRGRTVDPGSQDAGAFRSAGRAGVGHPLPGVRCRQLGHGYDDARGWLLCSA